MPLLDPEQYRVLAETARRVTPADIAGVPSPGSRTRNLYQASPRGEAYEDTLLGKVFKVLGTGERFGTKHTLGNALREQNPAKYYQLTSSGRELYASDWLRALSPEDDPVVTAIAGLIIGMLVDPSTYVGLGPITKSAKGASFVDKSMRGLRAVAGAGFEADKLARTDIVAPIARAINVQGKRASEFTRRAIREGTDIGEDIIVTPREFRKLQDLGGEILENEFISFEKVNRRTGEVTEQFTRRTQRSAEKATRTPKPRTRKRFRDTVRRLRQRDPKVVERKDPNVIYRLKSFQKPKVRLDDVRKIIGADVEHAVRRLQLAGLEANQVVDLLRPLVKPSSLAERAKAGEIGLFNLSVPFLEKYGNKTFGRGAEQWLQKLGLGKTTAERLAIEFRGHTFYKAVDSIHEAMRYSKFGQAATKHLGVAFHVDPRAVGVWHHLFGRLHGRLGKQRRVIGENFTQRITQITKELAPVIQAASPEKDLATIEKQVNAWLRDLFDQRVFGKRGKGDFDTKVFEESTKHYLPELYTSPHLGGPDHIGDSPLGREIRQIIRDANAFTMRMLRMEQQANVPMATLLGDTDYMMRLISEKGRKSIQGKPRFKKAAKEGKRLADTLREDLSGIRRSFRSGNLASISKLLARDTRGYSLAEKLPLLWTLQRADLKKAAGILRVLHRDGEIDDKTFAEVQSTISKILNPEGGEGAARAAIRANEEGLDLLHKMFQEGVVGADDLEELIHPWTIREINDHVRENGILSLGIKPGEVDEFFTPELDLSMVARGQRAERVVTDADYFRAMAQFGTDDPSLAARGWLPIDGMSRWVEGGGKLLFRPDVRKHFEAYTRIMSDPDTHLNQFLRMNAKILNWWKVWTLAIFPSYWNRNIVGNLWNNFLAGMGERELPYYHKSDQLFRRLVAYEKHRSKGNMRAARATMSDLPRYKIPVPTTSYKKIGNRRIKYTKYVDRELNLYDLYKQGESMGLFNAGRVTGDVERSMRNLMRPHRQEMVYTHVGMFPKPKFTLSAEYLGTNSWFADVGFRINGRFENNARLAHFMWRIDQGDNLAEAAASVRKYLFDYQMLTSSEREIRRHAIPFYTWTRNNIPLQLEGIVMKPEKFIRIPRTLRAGEEVLAGYFGGSTEAPADEAVMAEWMKEAFPVRIRKNKEGQWTYFLLDTWLPAMDLNRLDVGTWWMTLKSMANPLPKALLEQAFNQDVRTGRSIDAFEESFFRSFTKGERDRIFGQYLPRRVTHPLKGNIRLIRDLDKLFWNPDNLSIAERMLNLVVGRVYPSDTSRGALEFQRQLREIQGWYRYGRKSTVSRYEDTAARDEALRIGQLQTQRLREAVERRGF